MTERNAHNGTPYIVALVVLLALTALSFGVSYLELGAFSTVLALTIALIKTTVVVLIFMHLLETGFASRMVVVVNALWLAMLCLGIVADVAFR